MLPRIEEKFFIPARCQEAALGLLLESLEPAYPKEETRYTWIESVYFDTERLDLFSDHFLSPADRFKLRVRRYGPDGLWEDGQRILELKAKKGKMSSKTRFELNPTQFRTLMRGEAVPGLGPLSRLIQERGLRPVCEVVYRRHAFQEGELRVTLDEQLRYRMLGDLPDPSRFLRQEPLTRAGEMRDRFHDGENLVLEVKRRSDPPEWLTRFLAGQASGDLGFSKYCYSIAGALSLRSLRPPGR